MLIHFVLTFFPLFQEMFLIHQRKPTWYNGCQDQMEIIPSRKYLQVKDPFITLPLPLNACHIKCGLCLLLFSSLYMENSLDFAKLNLRLNLFSALGPWCAVSFFSGARAPMMAEVLELLDVWSRISAVCCTPLKGSWGQFACWLVMVKKGLPVHDVQFDSKTENLLWMWSHHNNDTL